MDKKQKSLVRQLLQIQRRYVPIDGHSYSLNDDFKLESSSLELNQNQFFNFLIIHEFAPGEEEAKKCINDYGKKPTIKWWVEFHTDTFNELCGWVINKKTRRNTYRK